MADIFDGIDKMSEDEIRNQIAILKNVNLMNSVLETGSRAMNRLISAAGTFLSAISGSDKMDDSEIINVKIVKVKDKVEQSFQELKGYDRELLYEALCNELIDKCGLMTQGEEKPSYEKIAVCTVREAAAIYGLDGKQPAAVLLDLVKERYYADLLTVLHRRLVCENESARQKTDGKCTLALRKVNIERLRELNKYLQLREFNPRSIMTAVRGDRTTKTLEKVLPVMGWEAFDLQGCIIGTVNEGMKTLIPAARTLLAATIWLAGNAYGRKFAINKDVLPGFVNDGRMSGVNEVDIRFMESVRKAGELEKTVKRRLADSAANNRRLVELENDLLQARLEQDAALLDMQKIMGQKELADEEGKMARTHLDEYERANPTADNGKLEYRQLKSQYEQAAANIRNIQSRLERAQKTSSRKDIRVQELRLKIKDCEKRSVELGNQLFEITKEYNDIVFQTENEADYRASLIKIKWNNFFQELQFDTKAFENVIKLFRTSELTAIEMSLYELNIGRDTAAYAHETRRENGEITGFITYSLVSSGKYAAIYYREKYIERISIKDR